MTDFLKLVRRHPVTSYFALAFLLSWGASLIVAGTVAALAHRAVRPVHTRVA